MSAQATAAGATVAPAVVEAVPASVIALEPMSCSIEAMRNGREYEARQ